MDQIILAHGVCTFAGMAVRAEALVSSDEARAE